MRVNGQLEYMQLEQSIPASITAFASRLYADITAPTAIQPLFHDGTAFRKVSLLGGSYANIIDTDVNAAAAIALTKLARTAPTVQKFDATGTTAGWLFTCSSFSATVGATYTNNGNTYTVLSTVAAGTLLWCSQAAAPAASGTLTKATGTGDATITFSLTQALAQLSISASALYIEVEMVAAGGGGGGSGTASGGTGAAGTITTFGTNKLICKGGAGATFLSSGNNPPLGTATINDGLVGIAVDGAPGQGFTKSTTVNDTYGSFGGYGGVSPFGGAGCQTGTGNGQPATANSGSGGGGAGTNTTASSFTGNPGSAGGYIYCLVPSPTTSYWYCVGVKGAGGGAGTNGFAGGNGGDGKLIVTTHFI